MFRFLQLLSVSNDVGETDRIRDRVRLYLQVMLLIDAFGYASDFLSPLFIEGLSSPDYMNRPGFLRTITTVFVAAEWAWLRFRKPSRNVAVAMETVATLVLIFLYVQVSTAFMVGDSEPYAMVFAMYGFTLLLSVRAALVPSPVWRTALVGIIGMGIFHLAGRERIAELAPQTLDGVNFIGVAFVIVTSITSFVIYGLRREVREALQLGQYTLGERLGEGGMGAVYRARHALLRREAAIKLIRPELIGGSAEPSRAFQRFEREAQVTAGLRSPHTVQLYDFGVSDEGAFYYVMEILEGVDLESLVAKHGPLPASRVTFLLLQVCESLQEAHQVGLVHRDIKPANIFLCRYGLRFDFVKVLDFGLVTMGGDDDETAAKLTVEGFAGGTPAYLAPEMVASPGEVDERADIYAVGCVAYWLLTGQVPFSRETPMATVLAHVNDTPLPPSSVTELPIPSELEALVLRCLAKDPKDRPRSVEALAEELGIADPVSIWTQDQARRWWETHQPELDSNETSWDGDQTIKLSRAFPG